MFQPNKTQYGQAGSDYVMIFFLVAAVILTMSTYVNRAIHGRHLMVRGFMYDQINAIYQDPALNLHGNLVRGYDPYYFESKSIRWQDSMIEDTLEPGVYGGTVPVARKDYLEFETGVTSVANQLAPKHAD